MYIQYIYIYIYVLYITINKTINSIGDEVPFVNLAERDRAPPME